MSDASGGDPRVHNLTTEEVARGLQEGRMLLVGVRSGCDSRSAGQTGRVRLPLRPALGHCFFGGAGEGLPVRLPSCGRHPCLEGRWLADRQLTAAARRFTFQEDRLCAVCSWPSALQPLPACC